MSLSRSFLVLISIFSLFSLLISFALNGVISNTFFAVLVGIMQLGIGSFYGYAFYKLRNDVQKKKHLLQISLLIFYSSLICFILSGDFFTKISNFKKIFHSLFVMLGLFASAWIPWCVFVEKFLLETLKMTSNPENIHKIIYSVLSITVSLIHSILVSSFYSITELEMVASANFKVIYTMILSIVLSAASAAIIENSTNKE